MKDKKGFTLIELLAVIVIMTIILVIAVYKIQKVIYESKVEAFRDSAKIIVESIENSYKTSLAFGSNFNMGSPSNEVNCFDVISLDTNEYKTCTYYFDENERVVIDLYGADTGKFASLRATGNKIQIDITETYNLTFDAQGGNLEINSKTINYFEPYGDLPIPIKEGYTFMGWFKDINGNEEVLSTTNVTKTGKQILYAKWTANTYTLTLDANNGTVTAPSGWTQNTSSTISKTITYDTTYDTLPIPTRTGYTFNGWYEESTFNTKVESSTIIKKTSNHTLFAKWTVNTYTLSLTLGSHISSIYYKIGTNAYMSTTTNTTIQVNYGTEVKIYAVPNSYYSCQNNSSNVLTFTMNQNGYTFNQSASENSWIYCSHESSNCTIPGAAMIKYGAGSSWTSKEYGSSQSVACSNGVFGDPIVNTEKDCYYKLK